MVHFSVYSDTIAHEVHKAYTAGQKRKSPHLSNKW